MRFRGLVLFLLMIPALPAQAGTPRVLATIKPIHSLVAAVMAGVETPALLITGAASGHTYVLKPSDARKIAGADIVFWVGPNLETFLKAPLANLAPHARRIALEEAKGIRLLAARPGGLWTAAPQRISHGHANPHVWLDPDNAIAMTRAIAAALSTADPAHAKRYAANSVREIERIEALDAQLARKLAPVRGRPYIVFHDAYAYFDTHYRLNAIGAVTVEPDRPVGPQRLARIRDALKSGRAVCIFREPQFPPALIETLVDGTHARIGVLDPLGADLAPGPGLYFQLLTRMADALRDCLGAGAR